nr:neurofilament heavy polypeptide like [Tanacetum cinerariifolium]
MEDQSSTNVSGGKSAKLLRYPLRSASKTKDEKFSPSIGSTSRRGKPTSTVSQSVSVLDISAAKEKSAKPPRRLSNPSKPPVSPAPKSVGYTTPASEARVNRAGNDKAKTDTPGSDVSRSLVRKKFTVLSSASYWLSHIKLSEAAGKHQLSLGFFKLALEAGCENVQLLKDELKSYAGRHNLLDLGESAKEVFQSYEILETIEQLQVSETCFHVPQEGSLSLDDDAHSLSSATGVAKLKPKSLNSASSAAKEATQKSNPVSRIKAPMSKKPANQGPALESGHGKMQKNAKKPIKQESNKGKQAVKAEAITPTDEKAQTVPKEAVLEENKENMDAPLVEEMYVSFIALLNLLDGCMKAFTCSKSHANEEAEGLITRNNERGHYINGLLLFTLDRLYRVVERHAKEAGEWQWVRDDLTLLGDPCLETSDKLYVISGLNERYHCLHPFTRHELLMKQYTTWERDSAQKELTNPCSGMDSESITFDDYLWD